MGVRIGVHAPKMVDGRAWVLQPSFADFPPPPPPLPPVGEAHTPHYY